ncbi:MAG: hypothetical protein V1660_02690 [archaeon]
MSLEISPLEDVNTENYFYVCNGTVLKNVEDLKIFLKNVDTHTFSCHVNDYKNDFMNWIRDAVRDETLALNISQCKTKEDTLGCVKKRISSLKASITRKQKESALQEKEEEIDEKKPFKSVYLHKRKKNEILTLLKES